MTVSERTGGPADPHAEHIVIDSELQRQQRIIEWAGVAKSQLHAESAARGVLRQFPDATKLLILFDRNGGQVRPVRVEGPAGVLSDETEGWDTKELPGTPGRSIWNDLASIDPDHVKYLHSTNTPEYHVFAVDLARKFYEQMPVDPFMDKPRYTPS